MHDQKHAMRHAMHDSMAGQDPPRMATMTAISHEACHAWHRHDKREIYSITQRSHYLKYVPHDRNMLSETWHYHILAQQADKKCLVRESKSCITGKKVYNKSIFDTDEGRSCEYETNKDSSIPVEAVWTRQWCSTAGMLMVWRYLHIWSVHQV